MMTAKQITNRGGSILVVPLDGTGDDRLKLGRAFVGAEVSPDATEDIRNAVFVTRMERTEDGGRTWELCDLSSNRGILIPGDLKCLERSEWPEAMKVK